MFLDNIKFHSGDTVYNTDKIDGIKPYSVLKVMGWSYNSADDEIRYILSYENCKYYVRKNGCLHLYRGQDLSKQRKRDILFQTLAIIGLAALTVLLCLWHEAVVKGA